MRSNETIDALRDMLGTALNVNQALVTLSQGEVVKRLAGWAAVLAVPTLVASWYGMKFENMPELGGRYSYPILIGALAIGCFGLYRYLTKVRWLSAPRTRLAAVAVAVAVAVRWEKQTFELQTLMCT